MCDPYRHTIVLPHHTIVLPHHTIVLPHHTIVLPHHTIVLPHHTIVLPHHTIVLPHHTIVLPHHTIVLPHHTMQSAKILYRSNKIGCDLAGCRIAYKVHGSSQIYAAVIWIYWIGHVSEMPGAKCPKPPSAFTLTCVRWEKERSVPNVFSQTRRVSSFRNYLQLLYCKEIGQQKVHCKEIGQTESQLKKLVKQKVNCKQIGLTVSSQLQRNWSTKGLLQRN